MLNFENLGEKFNEIINTPEWCLKHHKTIDRQEIQNNFYNTL
jgi:hypothetical protein